MSDAREFELEVFRADTAASKGITAADIAQAASGYDAAKNPAPLVLGHPEHDKPAKGVIQSLRADGARLFAKVGTVATDVLEGIRKGEWINRSVAFWHPDHPSNPTPGKYSIRHLGLLGASTPAIAGMEPMKFNAEETAIEIPGDPQPAVIFTAKPTETVIIEEKTMPDPKEIKVEESPEFIAEKKRADDAAAELETLRAKAKSDREAGNVAFVSGLVEAGKLPAGHKDDLIIAFNALPVEELTFGAAEAGGQPRKETPLAFFRRLFDAAKPQVIFEAMTPKGERKDVDPKSRGALDKAARDLVAEKKFESYSAAMEFLAEQHEL